MKKISLVIAVIVAAFSFAGIANASTPLSGWAWSSTIGWISFNSANSGSGGGPYSVSVATTSASTVGTLSGWAWTPNGGWLSFNSADTAGCPSIAAGSLNGCTASVDFATGHVTGWARASAGVGATGWDGWVELSGPGHATGDAGGTSGVTYVTSGSQIGDFVGFAWGGPVVGWVKFNTSLPVSVSNVPANPPSGNLPTGTCTTPGTATIPSGQGSTAVTSTITGISETGYNGTFSYVWYDGTNSSGVTSGSTLHDTFTYYTAGTYTNSIVLTDASGNTATITCGNVVVTNANPSSVFGLWPDQISPASTGIVPAQTTLNTLPPVRIIPGASLQMDYVWDSTKVSNCQGDVYSGPQGWDPSVWGGQALTINPNINNGIGSKVLPSLMAGVYKLRLRCTVNSQIGMNPSKSLMAAIYNFFLADAPVSTTSPNITEIDVVPSSVQEI